MMIEVLKN